MTVSLPAPVLEQGTMVETVAHWIDLISVALEAETGRLRLQQTFREYLRRSDEQLTVQMIEAARAGHQDCDIALRDHIREKIHNDEFNDLPPILKSYAQEALYRPEAKYPPARNIANTWARDVAIAVLVNMASAQWPYLPITRNRASKRPSVCLVVALALSRRGYPMGERQVERIHRDFSKLAARLDLSAFLKR